MHRRKKTSIYKLLRNQSRGVDSILIFRFFRLLHGRFWGIGSVISILIGASIGYIIRPDLLSVEIPLSQLGSDIRTAPFFSGAMFFAAYSLWRWRIYLAHTMKNARPVLPLISLSIFGLYLIALMPVTWKIWPARLHNFGVFLLGVSMLMTVLIDLALTKNRKNKRYIWWRVIKFFACIMIIIGGFMVAISIYRPTIFNYILLGEAVMFIGYSSWVILKVALGEGKKTALGRIVYKLLS